MKHPERKFLKLPEFPGGKEALKKYFRENLVYPREALKNHIQGIVHLLAEIDDNGNVTSVEIIRGIGSGCDEEAVRLMKNVRFGGVKNKGLRLKTTRRFKIGFRLPPGNEVKYHIVGGTEKETPSGQTKYSYTLHINREN